MIFFGHLGLTTLAFKAYEKVYSDKKEITPVDYRFVLAGAILPDIIDKPIGAFFFRGIFHNSRIFAHTLLFTAILLITGVYYYHKHKNNNLLTTGISCLVHLVLDSMWLYPGILFWPYFGLKFPERAEGDWVKSAFMRLISDPGYFVPEFIGFAIIAYYFIKLLRNRQIKKFLRNGKL